jgi:hypothetical protein
MVGERRCAAGRQRGLATGTTGTGPRRDRVRGCARSRVGRGIGSSRSSIRRRIARRSIAQVLPLSRRPGGRTGRRRASLFGPHLRLCARCCVRRCRSGIRRRGRGIRFIAVLALPGGTGRRRAGGRRAPLFGVHLRLCARCGVGRCVRCDRRPRRGRRRCCGGRSRRRRMLRGCCRGRLMRRRCDGRRSVRGRRRRCGMRRRSRRRRGVRRRCRRRSARRRRRRRCGMRGRRRRRRSMWRRRRRRARWWCSLRGWLGLAVRTDFAGLRHHDRRGLRVRRRSCEVHRRKGGRGKQRETKVCHDGGGPRQKCLAVTLAVTLVVTWRSAASDDQPM